MESQKMDHIDAMLENRLFYQRALRLICEEKLQIWFDLACYDPEWTGDDCERFEAGIGMGMVDFFAEMIRKKIATLDGNMTWVQSDESDSLYKSQVRQPN